jgi:hypothetical protein
MMTDQPEPVLITVIVLLLGSLVFAIIQTVTG